MVENVKNALGKLVSEFLTAVQYVKIDVLTCAGFDLLQSAKAFKQFGLEGRELSATFKVYFVCIEEG